MICHVYNDGARLFLVASSHCIYKNVRNYLWVAFKCILYIAMKPENYNLASLWGFRLVWPNHISTSDNHAQRADQGARNARVMGLTPGNAWTDKMYTCECYRQVRKRAWHIKLPNCYLIPNENHFALKDSFKSSTKK